jgi:hypothetical protein
MRLRELKIVDGVARTPLRVLAAVLGLLTSLPAISSLVDLCHAPSWHLAGVLLGWAWLPTICWWCVFTGLLLPEIRRRNGGR